MKKVKLSLTKSWRAPPDSLQLYNKKYRDMSLEEIEKEINFEKNYLPLGFKTLSFNWNTAQVFINK